jgi:pimeloyl-ACP methyl ester carboxylesterase
MLVLAYAAAHPGAAGPLVLIGCGTFDPISRARLQDTLEQRMDEGMRRRRDRLVLEYPDPNERLRAMGNLGLSLYSFDVDASDQKLEACDARAHEESWADMVRLQRDGVYPAAFSAIDSPVIMLHGNADPHPGQLIRAGLEPHLPQLEYREWDRCGHYPWLERAVRDEFFEVLREWLGRRLR